MATIVILAVISLIATPTALNMIEDARKNSAKDSAYGYIKAIENKVVQSALRNESYEDKDDYIYDEIKVDIKGKVPTSGVYSLRNGKVTNATFCINGYIVNYSNNKAASDGTKCKGDSLKLNGGLKLSSNSGQYIYPESKNIDVQENISGGTLSCTSDNDDVATCSVKDNKTIVVQSGESEGTATLTIKAAETSKYKEAQIAYVVTTGKGLLSYTANDYSGVYDGLSHGIVVSSDNAIIKYGETLGEYTSDVSPTYANVGVYTVYFEITRAGYNTITGSKTVTITKAAGEIKLDSTSATIQYDQTKELKVEKNKSGGNITAVSANTEIAQVSVEGENIIIKGINQGTTKITITSDSTNNYNSVQLEYTVTVTKANNVLTLSANTGNYTYPEKQTIEVTENKSGGTLSCTSDNENVATCSVKDNETITVTPGTTSGSATLTIKSAATDNYNEGQVVYVAITAKGLLSVSASDYSGVYDGKAHGITVTSSGATIKYGTTEGSYTLTENPTYTNVGTYTVYYQVTKDGYNTITGSKTITITKATGSVTAPTAKTLTYTGNAQTLINAGSSSTGTIQYKLGSTGTYSTNIPTATAAGTYTVYYKVVGNSNYNDVAEKSIDVTISKATINYTTSGYSGVYDGKAHGITVTASGTTIKYGTTEGSYTLTSSPTYTNVGTYTVYYQITREGYVTVTGSEKVTITKANNTLTLSANTGNYTYPTTGTFTVNQNTSGGTLSCTSSNTSVATCSISGTTVTVTPGTTEGSATLTIKSAATTNYNEAQASYVAATSKGMLSVTASDYSGVYDGKAHGITVTSSGATIKYGTTSGSYTLTSSPTYTNVGTYTVYYQVTRAGYKTVTGSKTVVITPATPTGTIQIGSNDPMSATNGMEVPIGIGETVTIKFTTNENLFYGQSFSGNGAVGGVGNVSHNVTSDGVVTTTAKFIGEAKGTGYLTYDLGGNNYNSISIQIKLVVSANSSTGGSFKLGDYVKMKPTLNNPYVLAASLTGYTNDQEIYSYKMPVWRVININGDGTIDMINDQVTTPIYFSGVIGYKNLVGTLNAAAASFVNEKYTIKSRHIGYNEQTEFLKVNFPIVPEEGVPPFAKSTTSNDNEKNGGGDINYEADVKLVKDSLGTLIANSYSGNTESSYWLASRHYQYSGSNNYYLRGRLVKSKDGSVDDALTISHNGKNSSSPSAAIRPIVTLRAGVKASSGDGTKGTPWVLD